MKLILLGTNGFAPTDTAQTACYMLPEVGVILDAGSGLYRLRQYLQTPGLDIYLTHDHGDHTAGLNFLFGDVMAKLLDDAGEEGVKQPGQMRDLVRQANDYLQGIRIHAAEPTLSSVQQKYQNDVTWVELQPREALPGGGQLTTFHAGNADEVGFRLEWPGHSMAYVTDTIARENSSYIDAIRGVDLLLHDCNGPDRLAAEMEGIHHSHTSSAARVACLAQVRRLVLIHHNPVGWLLDADLPSARQIFPWIEIGRDYMELEF